MSKTKRIRVDFDDTAELLELILILKDIATTLFQKSAKKKQILIDFINYFIDFFKIASFIGVSHPMVTPKVPDTAILAITSESPFMGDMNSRMIRTLMVEGERAHANEYIIVGGKAAEKVKAIFGKSKIIEVFSNISKVGNYQTCINVKDYVFKRVVEGKIGKIIAVYPFAININLIRPRTAVMFPSAEIFAEHQQGKEDVSATIEPVVVESNLDDVLGYLASVWMICRIYELLMNAETSGYAAQCQQLESAGDRLKKDKIMLGMMLRKSRKADISKSLAEVFSATMMRESH